MFATNEKLLAAGFWAVFGWAKPTKRNKLPATLALSAMLWALIF